MCLGGYFLVGLVDVDDVTLLNSLVFALIVTILGLAWHAFLLWLSDTDA